jgi:hypothetical protein
MMKGRYIFYYCSLPQSNLIPNVRTHMTAAAQESKLDLAM